MFSSFFLLLLTTYHILCTFVYSFLLTTLLFSSMQYYFLFFYEILNLKITDVHMMMKMQMKSTMYVFRGMKMVIIVMEEKCMHREISKFKFNENVIFKLGKVVDILLNVYLHLSIKIWHISNLQGICLK